MELKLFIDMDVMRDKTRRAVDIEIDDLTADLLSCVEVYQRTNSASKSEVLESLASVHVFISKFRD